MFGNMKYRPSKSFVYLMVTLCPLVAALVFGLLPELPSMAAQPIPGEITFSSEKPAKATVGTISIVNTPRIHPSEWFEVGYENLMKWEYNPWKTNNPYPFGAHYYKLLGSKDPKDQARAKELQRLAKAFYERLLLRYPEMAVAMKSIPDDQNGFLKWLEFSERLKKANSDSYYSSLGFPDELDQYLNHDGPWNAEAAKTWLSQQKTLIDEIRAIGLTSDASINGIDIDRWAFVPARLAKSCAESLMLEARYAAETGDTATALESIRAAKGLADHFTDVETPTLLGATIKLLIQQQLDKFVLNEIMPALPAGKMDPAAWESVLNPTVSSPTELAKLFRGDWSSSTLQYILPVLVDAEDPDAVPDAGNLLDAHTAPFAENIRIFECAPMSDLPTLVAADIPDVSNLSRKSRQIAETFYIATRAWQKGWVRCQYLTSMTQAAFAVMNDRPMPKDPIYGQDYHWDSVTRQISMPDGNNYTELDIKPITVPKP